MARIRDIPHVLSTVGWWKFTKRVYNQSFFEDNLLVWAAALAFSWLLALFPFLIFSLSLVPFLPERFKPSEQTILDTIEEVLVTGEPLSEASQEAIEETLSPEKESLDPDRNSPSGVPTTVPSDTDPASQPAPQAEETEVVYAEPEDDLDPFSDPPATSRRTAAEDDDEAEADVPRVGFADPLYYDDDEDEEAADDDGEPDDRGRQPAIISQTVTSLVSNLINERPGTAKVFLSIIIALFTASSGVLMTMAGLDKCYDVAPEKIRPFYKSRPLAMLLTIMLSFLIVLTVVILPIGGKVVDIIASTKYLGWLSILSRVLRWSLGLLLMFSAVGILYKLGPSVKTRLHLFSPGSIFVVFMWIATAMGFQFYLEQFNAADSYARTYGAVAGVAILMLLFYVDALFLLIGAEINAEVDFIRLGIKSGPLPEEREVATVPPYQLDEEDRELKAELESSRSVDIDEPAIESEEAEKDVLDA